MFELRGLSRDDLRAELAQSPLGQILASALETDETSRWNQLSPTIRARPREPDCSMAASHKEFWTGAKRLPAPLASHIANKRPGAAD